MRISTMGWPCVGHVMRLVLAALMLASSGATQQFPVEHHRSWWWNRGGVLEVTEDGVRFMPSAKEKAGAGAGQGEDGAVANEDAGTHEDAVALPWEGIQQLELTRREIRVVTYEDKRWQLGRDRHLRFVLKDSTGDEAEAGEGDFARLEELLRRHLGVRLVNALAGEVEEALWQVPAKRRGVPRGAEGTLAFTGSEVVFNSGKAGESRRWPLAQIDTVASTGPLSLTLTAHERAVADQGGYRSFEFQLKQPLQPEEVRKLWQAIETAHGTALRYHTP